MVKNIVPENSLMQSTFKILNNGSTGTCFQYIYKVKSEKLNKDVGHSFLVTVRHLFPDLPDASQVAFEIETIDGSKPMTGILYLPEEDEVDLAVIKIDEILTPGCYYSLAHNSYSIGQDAYFFGFPLGMSMKISGLNNGYPLPLVKKATLSAFIEDEDLFLFDGHNNPGFSGSPIGYHDLDKKETHVIGVVCAYYQQTNKIEWGERFFEYSENSGIFLAYSFSHAISIFDSLMEKNLLKMP